MNHPQTPGASRRRSKAICALLPAGMLMTALAAQPAAAQTATQLSGYQVTMPPSATAGRLTAFQPCTYKGLPSRATDSAQCATLVVAENPAKPKGRLIALPVVKLPALGAAKPQALFWFQGGPGNTNISYHLDTRGVFESQDVYMLGYRGVDDPAPLQCPEIHKAIIAPHRFADEAGAPITAAARACADRFTASGVDLSHYTMMDVIGDHESLRKALGLQRANLMSESYGTRVTQYYARRHPTSVGRSIQFSVNPPGHFLWLPEATNELLREYAKRCSAHPSCSQRTPDLFKSVVTTLARNDVSVDGKPVDMDKVRILAFFLLATKENAVMLFDAVLAAEKGDNTALASLPGFFDAGLAGAVVWGDFLAKGGSEIGRLSDRDMEERRSTPTSFGSPPELFYRPAIKGWPVQPLPQGFDTVVDDKTPTLLVSGNLDVITPARFVSEELLPHLPNGHHVVLSNQSHEDWGTEQIPAMDRLVSGFLRDGTVDTSAFVASPVPLH